MITVISCQQKSLKQIFALVLTKKKILQQFFGYLLSGSAATLVHYTILICMVEIFLINPILASSVGFLGGAITGFILNKRFVFCDPSAGKMACFRYLLMATIGAILNITILWILTNIIHLYYLLAQILATITIMFSNFICCKVWIFNKGKI